jgi:hypothetical protein
MSALSIAVIVKALLELSGFFLLGRGLIYVFAGAKREQNLVYQIFQVLTRPLLRIARLVSPRVVVDRHMAYVAFLIVFWLWLMLFFFVLPDLCAASLEECQAMIERKSSE